MANENNKIEHLDFAGLGYYDEKIKKWIKGNGGVSWGKIEPKPYKFEDITEFGCKILFNKEWLTSLLPFTPKFEEYRPVPESSKEPLRKLLEDIYNILNVPSNNRYDYGLRGWVSNEGNTYCRFLEISKPWEYYFLDADYKMQGNYMVFIASYLD